MGIIFINKHCILTNKIILTQNLKIKKKITKRN